MNLHYSQTVGSAVSSRTLFDYHMNLHYSQTPFTIGITFERFDYHMNLHYSQTKGGNRNRDNSLTIIWIYTTLKLDILTLLNANGLTIIWIYTTLKRKSSLDRLWKLFDYHMNLHYSQTEIAQYNSIESLTIIWIYTTLKLPSGILYLLPCLTIIWIYTTLKRKLRYCMLI